MKEIKDIEDLKQSLYYKKMESGEGLEEIEEKFDPKIASVASYARIPVISGLIENVKLLYQMLTTKGFKVGTSVYVAIGAALLYFISPIDVVPDFIPVAGLLDDAAVVALVVSSFSKEIERFKKSKQKKKK